MQLLFQFQYGFCRKHIKAYRHATPEVADTLQIGIVYSHFQPTFDLRVFDRRRLGAAPFLHRLPQPLLGHAGAGAPGTAQPPLPAH